MEAMEEGADDGLEHLLQLMEPVRAPLWRLKLEMLQKKAVAEGRHVEACSEARIGRGRALDALAAEASHAALEATLRFKRELQKELCAREVLLAAWLVRA